MGSGTMYLLTRGAPDTKKEKFLIAFPFIAIFSIGPIIFDSIIVVLAIVLYKVLEVAWVISWIRINDPFKNGPFIKESNLNLPVVLLTLPFINESNLSIPAVLLTLYFRSFLTLYFYFYK